MSISILGCGWLGLPLAKYLKNKGFNVNGSVRRREKFQILKESGIDPFFIDIADTMHCDFPKAFFQCDILIVMIPPKRIEAIEAIYPLQIGQILQFAEKFSSKRLLFTSSTSVYPTSNSEMTEKTRELPDKASGKALLKAEESIMEQFPDSATILRFCGLIGPGRDPVSIYGKTKRQLYGNTPVNLIHIDDCIEIIYQIISQKKWGHILNTCSDIHPTRQELYSNAHNEAGIEPPILPIDTKAKYKTINSGKLKKLLLYAFKYPNLAEAKFNKSSIHPL